MRCVSTVRCKCLICRYAAGRPRAAAAASPTSSVLRQYNNLNARCANSLAALIAEKGTLRRLLLGNNAFEDRGIESIADGLRLNNTLVELQLNKTGCRTAGFLALIRALNENTTLTQLDVSYNACWQDAIADELKRVLISHPSLASLSLAQTKLTSRGAIAIAEAIADSRMLRRLDLTGNKLDLAGLMALVRGLKINTTLTTLEYDVAAVGDGSSHAKQAKGDIATYLERNRQRATAAASGTTAASSKAQRIIGAPQVAQAESSSAVALCLSPNASPRRSQPTLSAVLSPLGLTSAAASSASSPAVSALTLAMSHARVAEAKSATDTVTGAVDPATVARERTDEDGEAVRSMSPTAATNTEGSASPELEHSDLVDAALAAERTAIFLRAINKRDSLRNPSLYEWRHRHGAGGNARYAATQAHAPRSGRTARMPMHRNTRRAVAQQRSRQQFRRVHAGGRFVDRDFCRVKRAP